MAPEKKTSKRLSYKRADVPKDCGTNLEALLRLAVANIELAKDRKLDVSDDKNGETFHLMSDYSIAEPGFVGVLCAYSPGRHQPVFSITDEAKTVPLETISPPVVTEHGKKLQKEFLDGCLYFLASGNHIVLSQSSSFRAAEAERYINWLLRECAKVVQAPNVILFQDQLPPAKEAKIRHAISLELSSPIELVATKEDKGQTKKAEIMFSPRGPFWEAVKSLLQHLPEHYSLNSAIKEQVIDAKLILKLARKGRLASKIIDDISTVARNTDDIDYAIDMGKYGKIKGEEFKLSRSIALAVQDGKIDQNLLFKKMRNWLIELIHTKRVHNKV